MEPIPDRRPFPVGTRTETLVDPGRGTPAEPAHGIEAAADRTIGLIVLYPADAGGQPSPGASDGTTADEPASDAGAGVVDGLEPPPDTPDAEVAAGAFPLLVFAHGWSGSGASLVAPARRWASAGYVVALPTFPLSRDGIASDVDMENQPGDVSFVIDTLLARAESDDDPLAGHIDADRVAVGGHSLGSATVFGFHNACCKTGPSSTGCWWPSWTVSSASTPRPGTAWRQRSPRPVATPSAPRSPEQAAVRAQPKPRLSCLSAVSTPRAAATTSVRSGSSSGRWICTT